MIKDQKPKRKALINSFDKGGLKIDIPSKITILQCSWVKRMVDKTFHERKTIPVFCIKKCFGKKIKFHGFLDISR